MKSFIFVFTCSLLLIGAGTFAQNVGINASGTTPDASAGLDVDFNNKGILIPRVSLVSTSSASPVSSPAISLLVYNTATANDVSPGFYSWNGTSWQRLGGAVNGTGTPGFIPKWTTSDTLGSSLLFDNGTNIGIGTSSPGAKLEIAGSLKVADGSQGADKVLTSNASGLASWQDSDLKELTLSTTFYPVIGTANTDIQPMGVAISGNYAYVVSFASHTLKIYNVSNPASPSLTGSIATGQNPTSVAVSGNYAYVTNSASNTMTIYYILQPASPLLVNTVSTGISPFHVAVSGNYAYVVNQGSNTMTTYNVTNPLNPYYAGMVNTETAPSCVAVSGNFAYVANYASSSMTTYDISNPYSPFLTSIVSPGTNTRFIEISGLYAYVVNQGSNNLKIYSLTTPEIPVLTGSASTGSNPVSVAVSGNYAYVVNLNSSNMNIFNVANPAGPYLADAVNTGLNPWHLRISGNKAFVVNFGGNSLQIFNIDRVIKNISMQDGNLVLVPETWSTSSGNIYNSNSGNVGIGTSAPGAKLDVMGGNIRTNQQLISTIAAGTAPIAVTSPTLVTNLNSDQLDGQHAAAFAPASGSGSYIQNGTSQQSSSNFNISGNGIVAGKIGLGTSSPSEKLDVVGGNIRTDQQVISTVGTGTAPFSVNSATSVANLNADLVDGLHAADFSNSAHTHSLTLTGDVTGSGDLSQSLSTTLSGSGVEPGSYGNSGANIAGFTVDAKGRLTSATSRILLPEDIEAAPDSGSSFYIHNQTAYNQPGGFRISGNGIFNGGNIGIGTINPAHKLHLESSGSITVLLNSDTDNENELDNPKIELQQDGTSIRGVLGLVGNANQIHTGDLMNSFYLVNETSNSLQFGTDGQIRMTILPNGYVGIGTNAPKVPLHVSTATTSTPFSSTAVAYARIVPSGITSVPSGGINTVNSLVSMVAEGDIVCKGTLTVASAIYFSSDQRLKDISGISNTLEDLELIKKIQITDYTMKDKVTWGFSHCKKVIAQQVEAVYPQAVTKTKGYIPNIYEFASSTEKTDSGYKITMDHEIDCRAGDKLRLELENKGTVEVVVIKVLDARHFEVASDVDLSAGNLFVYGMMVDDFRTVDYDAISMLNVSATQELARQLQQAQLRIEELSIQNEELKAQIGQIREYLETSAMK